MEHEDVDGLFVVIDLNNEEVYDWCETEELAKASAEQAQSLIVPAAQRASFAVCRLELLKQPGAPGAEGQPTPVDERQVEVFEGIFGKVIVF